jgi:hypothetical protein
MKMKGGKTELQQTKRIVTEDINIPQPVVSDMKCAPDKKFEDGSCIPLFVLVKMAEAYNKRYTDDIIPLDQTSETIDPSLYKRYLVSEFSKKLRDICDDQKCWVKRDFVKIMEEGVQEELFRYTWRPKGPQGKFTWLDTFNIKDSMEQYEKRYPDFKFLGAVPIDFDELPNLGIASLDFNKLVKKDKKTKIGIIFNLDEHDKGGSHWVSMYADIEDGHVYFSDSYGIEPENRIRIFMKRVADYIKKSGKEPVVDYNKIRAQRKGSECGVYSIAFIARMLKGDSFSKICKDKIPDDVINKCRKIYFN